MSVIAIYVFWLNLATLYVIFCTVSVIAIYFFVQCIFHQPYCIAMCVLFHINYCNLCFLAYLDSFMLLFCTAGAVTMLFVSAFGVYRFLLLSVSYYCNLCFYFSSCRYFLILFFIIISICTAGAVTMFLVSTVGCIAMCVLCLSIIAIYVFLF